MRTLLYVWLLLIPCTCFAADAKWTDETPVVKPPVETTEVPAVKPASGSPEAVMAAARDKQRIPWRLRREMGLTVKNLARVKKELIAEGVITDETGSESATAEIVNRLFEENPKCMADPQMDIDAIIEFIMRLMPLIEFLMTIFS